MPLIDLDIGEVLDRALVGTLDLIEGDAEGRIVVVDREAVRKKREAQYARVVRPLDRKRDALAAEVATRLRALSGGQLAEAHRLLGMIAQATASDGAANSG